MRRVEIIVEHFYKNKFMGRKRLKSADDMVVIGKSKDCGIRLLGEGVNPIHAMFDYSNENWQIADLGSERGTWVKKKPIVNHILNANTTITIGQHVLRVQPKVIENHLFVSESSDEELKFDPELSTEKSYFHQVILRKNTFVVETKLLPPDTSYELTLGHETMILKPPTSSDWLSLEFGDVVVQQRRVSTAVVQESGLEKLESFWDPDLKAPVSVAIVALAIISAFIFLFPHKPNQELEEVKPDQNTYTKMIYDAKAIRKKRTEAKKIRHTIARNSSRAGSSAGRHMPKVAASMNNKNSSRVVSKIRVAGLSQLIGKISKRSSRHARLRRGIGVAPERRSGRAGASIGSIGIKSKSSNKTFRIGSVKTDGKAGGVTSFGTMGALSNGNVGNASVGILEEETEIKGGLDKDVIARTIEKNLGQIRYCYERQLSANPDLYGKVLVKFSIGASGKVRTQNIGLTTLKSAMVEGCILRRVASWQFPKPKGGTQVLVTYPFLFKSTN